jgi:nitrogen fixation protein FixH
MSTNKNTTEGAQKTTAAGKAWALAPVVMIASMLGGLGYMAHLATDDPSFAVEKDYYKKAIDWDSTQAQAATNARLGWSIDLSVEPRDQQLSLVVHAKDSHGAPLRNANVRVEAFANARASHVVKADLQPQTDGALAASIPLVRPGLWEFRFVVESAGQRFTEVVRRDVGGAT